MEILQSRNPDRKEFPPLPSDSRPVPRLSLEEFENAQQDPKVQRAIAEAMEEGRQMERADEAGIPPTEQDIS